MLAWNSDELTKLHVVRNQLFLFKKSFIIYPIITYWWLVAAWFALVSKKFNTIDSLYIDKLFYSWLNILSSHRIINSIILYSLVTVGPLCFMSRII